MRIVYTSQHQHLLYYNITLAWRKSARELSCWLLNAAESRKKARSAAAEEGCTNRTCFTVADLIYFCRKYTIFTKFYEFMLKKVPKFANYAVAVLV